MPYRAIAYGGGPFSIDMNALWAIADISHRERISIERIRRMNYVVHRTLITKSERKFHNDDLKFLTPHPAGYTAGDIKKKTAPKGGIFKK